MDHSSTPGQFFEPISPCMKQCENPAISLRPEVKGSLTILYVLQLPVKILKLCGVVIDVKMRDNKGFTTWTLMVRRFYSLILPLILSWYSLKTVDFLEQYPESEIIQAFLIIASKIDFIICPIILFSATKYLRKLFTRFTDFQTEFGFAADVEEAKTGVNRKLIVLLLIPLLPMVAVPTVRVLIFSDFIETLNVWYFFQEPFGFSMYFVYHLYLSAMAVSIFTILSNLASFILKEYQDVRIKIKAFEDENNLTTSKLERLRRQQQKAHNLLRKNHRLAKTYSNATFLTILMKTFVFLVGTFNSKTVLERLLYTSILFELSRVSILILSVLWISKMSTEGHHQARKLLGSLFALSLENLSFDAQHQVFISQLTNQTHGRWLQNTPLIVSILGLLVVVALQIQFCSHNITRVSH